MFTDPLKAAFCFTMSHTVLDDLDGIAARRFKQGVCVSIKLPECQKKVSCLCNSRFSLVRLHVVMTNVMLTLLQPLGLEECLMLPLIG